MRTAFALVVAAISTVTAVLLSPSGGAHASAAPDTSPPKLVSITFSRAKVAVSGVATVPVTVSVRLTDDTGVVEGAQAYGHDSPLVTVPGIYEEYVPYGWLDPGYGVPPLKLTSGTSKDGVWSTVVHIPSTYDGVHHVIRVQADDAVGNHLDVDPRTKGIDRTLTVIGRNQPHVSIGFSPGLVRGYGPRRVTMKGRATYSGTGRPIPHLRLVDECGWGPEVRTDSRGYYSIKEDYYWESKYSLSIFIGDARATCQTKNGPRVQFLVRAAVSRTSVRLGRSVAVAGHVAPPAGGRVYFQRLTSRGWRTVTSARVRSSGRYTLITRPPTVGTQRYRVYKPGSADRHYVSNVSPTVRVRLHR